MGELAGTLGSVLGIGTGVSGIVGNIMNSITRGKEVGKLQEAEKKFASLTPEQLSGLVSRAEQPLSQDLLQSVGNLVQADVAGRGLAESPGVFAATETQALAPYKIEQQRMAIQLVMKQLGLPIEYADAIINAVGPNADLSKVFQMLLNQNQGSSGDGSLTIDPANIGGILVPGTPGSADTGTSAGAPE